MLAVAAELSAGASAAEASRRTGIPWRTIRKWELAGMATVAARRLPARLCAAGTCALIDRLPEDRYAYLLGQYLGDGSLVRFPRTWRLEVHGDEKYVSIVSEVRDAMLAVMPTSKVGIRHRNGCAVVSSYGNHWACLFPQHGPGPKHSRTIELAPWQREIATAKPKQLLRGLVHSDGCRVINTVKGHGYPRYHFSNRSDDIRGIFVWACEVVGIECRHNNRYSLSVARRQSVEQMDTFIGPKR
ncbi:MAG TPA: hypothetical protein VFU93_15290 [Acidimicrobiales bacterium]|nr:hypothetical protein [Acidimicrobiales bacterium]